MNAFMQMILSVTGIFPLLAYLLEIIGAESLSIIMISQFPKSP